MHETTIVKGVWAIALGLLATFWNLYGGIIISVAVVIALDLVSGLVKSGITGQLSSSMGYKGILKKTALLIALILGIFLDYCIPNVSMVNFHVVIANPPFGMIMGIYIIINECLSIIENLIECGVPIPMFIKKRLLSFKEDIDSLDGVDTTDND